MRFRPGVPWHSYYRRLNEEVMRGEAGTAALQREMRIKETAGKEAEKAEKEAEKHREKLKEEAKKPKPPKVK